METKYLPKPLTVEQILEMDLPEIIIYAIPVMLGLTLFEFILSAKKNKRVYDGKDFMSSLAIGVGNLVVSALLKTSVMLIFLAIYNFIPWQIPHTWWAYILCLISLDFFRYWAHRIAHEQRFWWATHVVHHNSNYYNWSVSFRLSWTQHLKTIFFLPVIVMGFDPVMFFIVHQIEVLYQFWIHTEFIGKLPRPIEYIFTTPSHHRVHHAVNDKYLDKNYGSTFIIWDRMFGTFQPEEEQAVYGITKPIYSHNPITLVFHVWKEIFTDLFRMPFKKWVKLLFSRPQEPETPESTAKAS